MSPLMALERGRGGGQRECEERERGWGGEGGTYEGETTVVSAGEEDGQRVVAEGFVGRRLRAEFERFAGVEAAYSHVSSWEWDSEGEGLTLQGVNWRRLQRSEGQLSIRHPVGGVCVRLEMVKCRPRKMRLPDMVVHWESCR